MSGIGISLIARPITAEPYPRVGAAEADDTTHRINMGAVNIHISPEVVAQWIAVLTTITEENNA